MERFRESLRIFSLEVRRNKIFTTKRGIRKPVINVVTYSLNKETKLVSTQNIQDCKDLPFLQIRDSDKSQMIMTMKIVLFITITTNPEMFLNKDSLM